MDREARLVKALTKLAQRKRLMAELGPQKGILYRKHLAKVKSSLGYMRTGNVSHYVAVSPSRKTRKRNRYGKVLLLSHRGNACIARMDDQMSDLGIE